jgi:pimeloyl-ACP methyl ester carboxylesterase
MPSFTITDAAELFRAAPQRYLEPGAGEVAYRSVGTGPDVLFVHGWPVSGATYRCLLPHLVDHVTCHLIDLPSAGQSRFDATTTLSIEQHITSVRRVVDLLELNRVAVVGDERLSAMGLIDTEQSQGLSLRFKMFLANRHVPGFGKVLGWLAGKPALRRNGFVLGDAFVDRSLLDGEFDEFFLHPLATDPARRAASTRVLKSFETRFVHELGALHRRIDVPVQLVWGAEDKFFPLAWAEQMVGDFADAQLAVVPDAGLFSHEERPAEVAAALLPVLTGTR